MKLVTLAEQLSPLDKVRLVERVMSKLEYDLAVSTGETLPSVYGLWRDFDIDLSADAIDEARQEMWGNFPREDIS